MSKSFAVSSFKLLTHHHLHKKEEELELANERIKQLEVEFDRLLTGCVGGGQGFRLQQIDLPRRLVAGQYAAAS